MTAPTPSQEPAIVAAGDTVKWQKHLPDFLAVDGWSLTYTFVNASARFTVTAGSASGADHLITVPASTTGSWAAGTYDWRAQVSKSGEVYTVGTGRMVVQPSFSAATDARSQARRMLEAVESVLEGRASSAVQDYQIAGRSLRHIPIPDLLTLRDRLRMDVTREDAAADLAAGRGPRGRIQVRFGQ